MIALTEKFVVTKPDGTVFQFNESKFGLFYLDTAKHKGDDNGCVLVTTVDDNKSSYTNDERLLWLGKS